MRARSIRQPYAGLVLWGIETARVAVALDLVFAECNTKRWIAAGTLID
jgi:hypothetical protein